MARSKRTIKRLGVTLGLLGVALGATCIDWRPADRGAAARVAVVAQAQAGLHAGAASVPLELPAGLVVAGYPPRRPVSTGFAAPLFARVAVVRSGAASLGIVSLEVLEVPGRLASKIREEGQRLGLSEVIVAATHPHSSFGGYEPNLLAQIIAIGRHDERVEAGLAAAAGDGLRLALGAMRPATLRLGTGNLDGLSRSRKGPESPVDPRLVGLRLDGADGAPIARLMVFGAHPTLVPRRGTLIDGDYPSRVMRAIEQEGGVALFLQGALGDVSSRQPAGDLPRADIMGTEVAKAAGRILASAAPAETGGLAVAAVEVDLPPAEVNAAVPALLRRPSANVVHAFMPRSARIDVVRIGPVVLAFTPGEATVAVAERLRERLDAMPGVELSAVVSLAQGYIGYLETEQNCREGRGEAIRSYYGPMLSGRVEEGVTAAIQALTSP